MARNRSRLPKWIATGKPIVAPPPLPPEELEAAVDDGLLIARFSAVLALKNRLIVSALRDDEPFDRDSAARAYAAVVADLAIEQDQNADHAAELIDQVELDPGVARHEHDYKSRDVELLSARRAVYRRVAKRLRDDARDPEVVARVVEEARERAWEEIARELSSRLDDAREVAGVVVDDEYRRLRAERMRRVREFDLWELAESREAAAARVARAARQARAGHRRS
ncbi:hypothetical protein N1031_00610 [Herbiconiux moechotypicola]|uniref:Asparagine synthase n=1 Tax=Herbiconiux moechotypicola TaxID=637393 RepID=A0ABP5Q2J0_9MICO|nr:hypothetical protein [Herbiconiux moechotypicola]MCS5728252.1 hypothetical protein [Herbiconiux moechotypicola]